MTLKVRIIPCLDVKDGRVVKGVNFVNLVDAGDPVEQAKIYDREGADELTFLDITASHEKRGTILDVVQRTAEACFMPLTVGGGVRTGCVIGDRCLHRIAGIDEVDEIDALDDASVLDVETGNDTDLEHQVARLASRMSLRASAASRRPS